jgi:hypothetical protein
MREILRAAGSSGDQGAAPAHRPRRGGGHYKLGWEDRDPLVDQLIDLPDRLPGPGTDNLVAPGGFEPTFKLPGTSSGGRS